LEERKERKRLDAFAFYVRCHITSQCSHRWGSSIRFRSLTRIHGSLFYLGDPLRGNVKTFIHRAQRIRERFTTLSWMLNGEFATNPIKRGYFVFRYAKHDRMLSSIRDTYPPQKVKILLRARTVVIRLPALQLLHTPLATGIAFCALMRIIRSRWRKTGTHSFCDQFRFNEHC